MGRKRKQVWRWRALAALWLLAMAAGAWGWWMARGWQPARSAFPVQGLLVGERDGAVDFSALAASGADFVYLEASRGASGRDTSFARNLAAVEALGMRHGAVHEYDPCIPAERQAANFVTMVPRDAALLPSAIALEKTADQCGDPLVEAGLESELTTFINQVENHTGQPVVLKLAPGFEDHHHIAARIERNLWLEADFLQPDYAGRPWTLWTASSHFVSDYAPAALRWVVVQP